MTRSRFVWILAAYGLLAAIVAAILFIGASLVGASGEEPEFPNLPEVSYLGEGPEEFVNETGDFVVKTKPFDLVLREGPEYHARKGQRVWAVEEETSRPVHVNDGTWDFHVMDAGCRIAYTIIDDDVDERYSKFDLNGSQLHAVPQGMVSYGEFEIPETGIVTFRTADSVGLWADVDCPRPEPVYTVYMPIVAGRPLTPPAPVCQDYNVSVDHSGGVETFLLQEGSSEPVVLVGNGESGIQQVGRVIDFTSDLHSTFSFSLGSGGYWVSAHYLGEQLGRRESWSMVAYGPRSTWAWNPNETASWDLIEVPHSEHVLTTIRGTTPDGLVCGRSFIFVVDPPLNRSTLIHFDTPEGPIEVNLSK